MMPAEETLPEFLVEGLGQNDTKRGLRIYSGGFSYVITAGFVKVTQIVFLW